MINRDSYIEKLLNYVDTPFVKILTGVHRCGKTTILALLQDALKQQGIRDDQIVTFRFDSAEYEDVSSREIYTTLKSKVVEGEKTYFFLDEIQEVGGWDKMVNTLATDYDADIYITCSNARTLQGPDGITYLTGRHIIVPIFTLSFEEYFYYKAETEGIIDAHKELSNYLRFGGFPAIHLQNYTEEEVYAIVSGNYNSTEYGGVLRLAFSNIGKKFSQSTISDFIQAERNAIDMDTVYDYLTKLEEAYILHHCPYVDLKTGETLRGDDKYYLADTAFRYSVLGYDPMSVSYGLNNIIFLELLRRGYKVSTAVDGDFEVDFVATRQNDTIYVKVDTSSISGEGLETIYNRLLDIRDNYPKYVLRADDFAGGNYKGIKTMHIADFLLDEGY